VIELERVPLTQGVVLGPDGGPAVNASVTALDETDDLIDLSYTDTSGRFALTMEPGRVVRLIALPAPTDAPYWDRSAAARIPLALAAQRFGVESGEADLVLRLPSPPEPGAEADVAR
jgi:hypothetical protein